MTLLRILLAASLCLSAACTAPEDAKTSDYTVKRERFQRSVPAEGYLKAETSTPISTPAARKPYLIGWIEKNGSLVKKGDVVVRFDQRELKKKLQDGESEKQIAQSRLMQERMRTAEAAKQRRTAAQQAKTDLERASSRAEVDTTIFSQHEIASSAIDGELSQAKFEHAQAAQGIERSISASKLKLLSIQEKRTELEIQQAKEGLGRTEVTAPHDGIFVYSHDELKAGDTLWPGWSFARLPLVESMVAEVFVLEADAMGLEKGKEAEIFLESAPSKILKGTIKAVANLAKPKQKKVPIQYFSVILEFDKSSELPKEMMKPGARIRSTLNLEASEALVVPRHCVFEEEGKLVVFRKSSSGYQAVKVTLGSSTPGRVVIAEGLSEGDEIATSHPFSNASSSAEQEESN